VLLTVSGWLPDCLSPVGSLQAHVLALRFATRVSALVVANVCVCVHACSLHLFTGIFAGFVCGSRKPAQSTQKTNKRPAVDPQLGSGFPSKLYVAIMLLCCIAGQMQKEEQVLSKQYGNARNVVGSCLASQKCGN